MSSGLYAGSKSIAVSDLITTVLPERKGQDTTGDSVEEKQREEVVVEGVEEHAEESSYEKDEIKATDVSQQSPPTPQKQDTKTELTDTAVDGDLTLTESDQDEDLKSQEVLASPEEMQKLQSTFSALKRSFLEEGGGDAGLTEWDKRLACSPVRRTDDAPMIEPLEPDEPKPTFDEMSPELTALLNSAREQETFREHNLLKMSEEVETIFLMTESYDQDQPMAEQPQVATGYVGGSPPTNPPPPPPGGGVVHDDADDGASDDNGACCNRGNGEGDDDASSQASEDDDDDDYSEVSEDAISVLAQVAVEEVIDDAIKQSNDGNQDSIHAKLKVGCGEQELPGSQANRPESVLSSRAAERLSQHYDDEEDSDDFEGDEGGWRLGEISITPSLARPPCSTSPTQPSDGDDDEELKSLKKVTTEAESPTPAK